MSRCFSFPPPGYEKKARTKEVNVLKKEKNVVNKNKEKKYKENSESKEKRKKDRSDRKHRHKKGKKEKHRDKKKDKCNDEDRGVSDEKRLFQRGNVDKTANERNLLKKSEVGSREVFTRNADGGRVSAEKKISAQYLGNWEGIKPHLAAPPSNSKFVQESGRRIKVEDVGAANQLIEKLTGKEVKLVSSTTDTWAEGIEGKNTRKSDGLGRKDEVKIIGSGFHTFQSLSGVVQTKRDGMSKPLEDDDGKLIEIRGTVKKNANDDKHARKYRDKDIQKKCKGKEKDRVKDREENRNEKREYKNSEQDKFRSSNKVELLGIHHVKTSSLAKESTKSAIFQENLRKRKELDTNGFLCANDIKPAKLPTPVSSFPPLAEDGIILQNFQNPVPPISGGQGLASNPKMNVQEEKTNGTLEAQASSVSLTSKPLSTATKPLLDQIFKFPEEQPHQDSKFLHEVLTVPTMEQWPEFDDHEWLLQSNSTQPKKPKADSGVGVVAQAWSEALRIESVDVYELPYVVPY
ncbi:hypothetical protein K2173_011596 [Erythroxylum novogranatense]|uniref:Uncharacterized protein n=1 Tax=Erythroxylum novogranatense TaxID=1862640 RepID=A0AAV8U4V7_9ROSI|nr:hypothetical protein K2173_011596 [Erythroxylum novogranatense]